jgi:hypothetical protein
MKVMLMTQSGRALRKWELVALAALFTIVPNSFFDWCVSWEEI